MADSSSEEKTEKPSAQKLRKAREEGQLPRSKDMGLAASLFAAFVVISSSFPWYADFVRESFTSVHQYAQEINNPEVIGQFLRHHLLFSASLFLPCCRCPPPRCSPHWCPAAGYSYRKKSSQISAKSAR